MWRNWNLHTLLVWICNGAVEKKFWQEGFQGTQRIRTCQESVSLSRQKLHWQTLSDVTILEIWSLLKACNFHGKSWTENCSQSGPISAINTVAVTHPPNSSHVAGSCAGILWATWAQLVGYRMCKKVCILQIRCNLCSDYWLLLLITQAQMNRHQSSLLYLFPLLQNSPLTNVTSRRFQREMPFYYPYIFCFSSLRSQTLKTRTFENKCTYRKKLESSCTCPNIEKTECIKFIPQADAQHRGYSSQWKQNQQTKSMTKIVNSGETWKSRAN